VLKPDFNPRDGTEGLEPDYDHLDEHEHEHDLAVLRLGRR
jgi:hypothetical protein